MTWRLALIITAVILFLLAAIGAAGWVDGMNTAALGYFGLAAFAGAHLP